MKLSSVVQESDSARSRTWDSKVASTPRMTPAYSLSPSMSSIANQSDKPCSTGSTFSFLSARNQEDLNDSTSTNNSRIKEVVSMVQWEGVWKSLKPKNKQGLYYKVMSHPHECEAIVNDWLSFYQRQPEPAVIMVLQFLVDVSGCQDLDIRLLYKFQSDTSNNNATSVINAMENMLLQASIKEAERFLFMKTTKISKGVELSISNFLEELILVNFKTDILFDEVFSLHVFGFIECMSFNHIKNIRITGVLFSIKLLTALLKLLSNLITFINKNLQDCDIKAAERRKHTLEKFIDFFCFVYDKNCLICDNKCTLIRIKCAEEVFHWIKLFPEVFIIKRKNIGRLLKAVVDNVQIFLAMFYSLRTFEKLIDSVELYQFMKQKIQLCLMKISERIRDVNYKVASKAIDIFSVATERYSEFIIKEYKILIINQMFQRNYMLARSSANFLIRFFRSQKKDDQWVLLSLVKIAFHKEEFSRRVPMFLEAMENLADELKNFNIIIEILLNRQTDFYLRKCLLQVVTEEIRYYLTGKYSQQRNELHKPKQRQMPADNHNEIARLFLPNIKRLMSEFSIDKNSCRCIIEIVSFIDFRKCSEEPLTIFMDTIMLFEDIFRVSLDNVLLERICCVLYNLCNSKTEFENHAKALVDKIIENYSYNLTKYLNKLTTASEQELLIKIREKSLKASILFSKFNLTNILQWDSIFLKFEKYSYFKGLKYLMVCCRYHLIWRLREIIATNNEIDPCLYNDCKEFVHRSLIILNCTCVGSATFLIFENLYDFYMSFELTLRRHRNLQKLFIKVEDHYFQEILIQFIVQHILESKHLSLDIRQKHLSNMVDLICLEVIPIAYFSKILRFYNTHYMEFGPIMDYVLGALKSVNLSLPCIVMHTLAEFYSQILEKSFVVDILSDEAIQLKLLSKKFANSKELNRNKDALKLVLMAINFSFTTENHYQFLYFARYFVKILNEEAKSEAYQLYKENIPAKDKNNDIILIFGAGLKPDNSE